MDTRFLTWAAVVPACLLALHLTPWAQPAPPAPPAQASPAAADPAATQALHALFARHDEWSQRTFPEFATYRGDHRYGDRLSDASRAGIAAREQATRAFVEEARAIAPQQLATVDRVSRELFIRSQSRFLEQAAHPHARFMSIRALGGPQNQFVELLQVMPMDRVERVEQALARMGTAFPVRMDQEIELLRHAASGGWIPARDVLTRAMAQIDAQLPPPAQPAEVEATPFYAPFRRLGRDIDAAQRDALQQRARTAIRDQVLPAMRRLRAFIADELLPRAPAEGGVGQYPGGEAWYALQVREQTTTDLTPRQIHELGLREMARIRAEMEAVQREVKFAGTFEQFVQHLQTDPKYFHDSGEALLAGYREIAKRIDAELPRLFAELPRAPYGVRAMPAHMGVNRAEYYNGPALDGSRAGFFFINALAYKKRPKWGMETLVAHEAMPGHHLQIARATELKGLPPFRRSGFGYTAFSEGWALYAETLGFELGLYADPLSRFGHLQWQAFRAGRLVVDTGIHAFGWSRQRAIDYLTERTGEDRELVESEIDRYSSQPGQALAYMIGKLTFDELRDRAKARLGAKFDIRRFHNAVLDHGALPMMLLRELTDEWMAAEAAR